MRLTKCRVERLRQGMSSAAELATATGIPRGRFWNWESAQSHRYLSKDEVARVADALGVTPETIADDRGAPILFE